MSSNEIAIVIVLFALACLPIFLCFILWKEVWADDDYDDCDYYDYVRPSNCEARQYSDMMWCKPCALKWDTNGPYPPKCLGKQLCAYKEDPK